MAILRLKIVYVNRESPAEPTAEMTRWSMIIFLFYKNQTAQQKPRDPK